MSKTIRVHLAGEELKRFTDTLASDLNLKTEIGRHALEEALGNVQLLDSKQQDYGSQNIARHGEMGLVVRIDDKTARLQNLLRQPESPIHESIDDTWMDISNYGLIGQLIRKGLWK